MQEQNGSEQKNIKKNRYLQLKSRSTQFMNDNKHFHTKQNSQLWWGLKENVQNNKQIDR